MANDDNTDFDVSDLGVRSASEQRSREPESGRARRIRRVVIEEDQRRKLEHARGRNEYAADLDPHAHDPATFRLINQRKQLDLLPLADDVLPLLDKWKMWDKLNDWDSRNKLLEDLIGKLRRCEASESEVQLLVTLCKPTWNAVTAQLQRYGGAELDPAAQGIDKREEVRRVNDLDRHDIDQVVHLALMESLYTCPRPFPRRFFLWLKETLAYRVLDHIRADMSVHTTDLPHDNGIQGVLNQVLQQRQTPASPRFSQWIQTMDLNEIFDLAKEYASYARVRGACEKAVSRLPNRQQQVIRQHYFEAMTQEEIARTRGVADSTVRNTHMHALGSLRRDDEFFIVLEAVGQVRDRDRKLALRAKSDATTLRAA